MYAQCTKFLFVKIELVNKTLLHCVTPNNNTH